ncbi:gamma-glutamyltransferase, partial [Tamlana crocina]
TVAGIFAVHEKFGTLPMEELLEPVILLARNGFVVTQNQQNALERYREEFLRANGDTILFVRDFNKGDTLKNTALALTLERLTRGGKKEFYEGEIAKNLVAFLQEKGGL